LKFTDEELKKLPSLDGLEHINIYSKAHTELGRSLSNFANSPFKHTDYGMFMSVEAFWYWLKTDKKFPYLKDLYGYHAKKEGKRMVDMVRSENPEYYDNLPNTDAFQNEIKTALRLKLKQNKDILTNLVSTDLPLLHYYYYGNSDNAKVHMVTQYDWITDELELLRKLTKEVLDAKKEKINKES